MDPLTHFLTGACIGRAGFNRKTAYATVAAVLAAEAADLDVLWGFAGPVEELKHHRGITHTFVAAPVVAGVVVCAVAGAAWLFDRWRCARRKSKAEAVHDSDKASCPVLSASSAERAGDPDAGDPDARYRDARDPDALAGIGGLPPLRQKESARMGHGTPSAGKEEAGPSTQSSLQAVRWGWLYLTALVAALSHLLLDWSNNYGLRPFFPFNPRWYAGSFMFILEPEVLGLLVLALVMPWLLGLSDREIGVRRQPFRGRGWAIFGLSAMAVLFFWRWEEHAVGLAMLRNTQVASEPVTRMALEPYPMNPYRWHAILETRDFYQTAEVNTWDPNSLVAITSDPQADVLYKPADTPAVEAAKQTLLGRVYLDWGTWAVVRDVGQEPVPALPPPDLPPGRRWTTVTFNDLRFDYSPLAGRSHDRAPLSGWVYIVDGRDEAGEGMGNRVQK